MLREGVTLPRPTRGSAEPILEAIERTERKIEDLRRAIPDLDIAVQALESVGAEHRNLDGHLSDLRDQVEALHKRLGSLETSLQGLNNGQQLATTHFDQRLDTLKQDLTIYFAVVGGIAGLIAMVTLLHAL